MTTRGRYYPAPGVSVPFPTATDPALSTAGAEADLTPYIYEQLTRGLLLGYDPLGTTYYPGNVDHFYDVRYASSLTSSRGEYDNQLIAVIGSSSIDDGGEGLFYWVSGSSETADNALVYGSTSWGRWKRLYDSELMSTWFTGSSFARKVTNALIAASGMGGGTVRVPVGQYTVGGVGSDRILLQSNTKLVFEPGSTISTGPITGYSYVFLVDSTTGDKENITVEGNGLFVSCSSAESSMVGFGIGVNVQNEGDTCSKIRFSDITVKGARYDGIYIGGNASFIEDLTFQGVRSTHSGRNGGSITGQVKGVKFIDCEFSENGVVERPKAGFDVEMNAMGVGSDIEFVRCKFNDNIETGFLGQSPYYGVTARVKLDGCEASRNGLIGIAMTVDGGEITSCRANENGTYGFYGAGNVKFDRCIAESNDSSGFSAVGGREETCLVSCTARWNAGSGFSLNSLSNTHGSTTSVITVSRCSAIANNLRGIDLSGCSNATVESCTAGGNRQEGIRLTGNSRGNRVVGNTVIANSQILDNAGDGVILETSSSFNSVVGNSSFQSPSFFHGTAMAAGSSTSAVELSSGSAAVTDMYKGMTLRIIAGTQSGNSGTITSYNGTTRVAQVKWSTSHGGTLLSSAPDATSTIEICGFRVYGGPVSGSTSTTIRLPTELSPAVDDIFNGMIVNVVSGSGSGQYGHTVVDYDGATRTLTVSGSFTTPPARYTQNSTTQSTIEIVAVNRPRYGIRINPGCVQNSVWGNDVFYGGATGAVSDAGGGTTTSSGNRTT